MMQGGNTAKGALDVQYSTLTNGLFNAHMKDYFHFICWLNHFVLIRSCKASANYFFMLTPEPYKTSPILTPTRERLLLL